MMGYFFSGQTGTLEEQRWKYENSSLILDLETRYYGNSDNTEEIFDPLREFCVQLKPVQANQYLLHYLIGKTCRSEKVQEDAGSNLENDIEIKAYAQEIIDERKKLPEVLTEEIICQIRKIQPVSEVKEKELTQKMQQLAFLSTLSEKEAEYCWKILLLLNETSGTAEEFQRKVLMRPGFRLLKQKDFCLFLAFHCSLEKNGKVLPKYKEFLLINRLYKQEKNIYKKIKKVKFENTDTVRNMINSCFSENDKEHRLTEKSLTEIIDRHLQYMPDAQTDYHSRRLNEAYELLKDLIQQTRQQNENVVNLLDQIYGESENQVKEEDTAPYMSELIPVFEILENTKLNNTRLSSVRNRKSYYRSAVYSEIMKYDTPKHIDVRRQDILTMGWLRMIFEWEKYGDAAEFGIYGRIADFVDYIDPILLRSGYYPFYMGYPYDHLLIFLFCYENPLKVFQYLWSMTDIWRKNYRKKEPLTTDSL